MKRIRLFCGLCCAALAVTVGAEARPHSPREVARQLLADDFAALNRGEKSLSDVAANACLLAEQAEIAVQEVLLAGAVRLYERAGDAKGEADARQRLDVLRRPFVTHGDEAVLRLGRFGDIAFVHCPTGTVDLPRNDRGTQSTRVRLTRPYWIMKYPLTCRAAAFYSPLIAWTNEVTRQGESPYATPNRMQAEQVMRCFTERLGDKLPQGYVVRLPTVAEWEYAFHAGGGPTSFLDLRQEHHDDALGTRIFYDYDLAEPQRRKLHNAWGIGDWCWQEKLLDAIDERLVPNGHSGEKGVFQTYLLPPPTTLENPVHVCTNEHAGTLIRMPAWARWKVAMRDFENDWCPLRFVIAPAIPGF